MPNEVEIHVTAKDDTGRTFSGVKAKAKRAGDEAADEFAGSFSGKLPKEVGAGVEKAAKETEAKAKPAFEKAGEEAGKSAGKGFDKGSKSVGKSASKTAKDVDAKLEAIKFAVFTTAMPAAAAIGAAGVSVALTGATLGFAALGVYAASSSAQVRKSFSDLKSNVVADVKAMGGPMEKDVVGAIDDVNAAWGRMKPAVQVAMAGTRPLLKDLTGSVTDLAENAMPGFVVAIDSAGPALRGFRSLTAQTGSGLSDFFINLSRGSESSEQVMTVLGGVVRDLEAELGTLLANFSNGGSGPLQSFRSALQTVYTTLNTITTSGMPALSGATSGFLTTLSGALGIVNGFASGLGSWAGPLANIAGQMKAMDMITFGKLSGGMKGLYKDLGTSTENASKLDNALGGTAGKAGIAGAALVVLGVALKVIGDRTQDANDHLSEHASTVDRMSAAFRASKGAVDANALAVLQTDGVYKKAAANAHTLGINVVTMADDMAHGRGATSSTGLAIQSLGNSLISAAKPAGDFGKFMEQHLTQFVASGGAAKDMEVHIDELATAWQMATGASDADTAAYKSKVVALYDLAGQYNQTSGGALEAARSQQEFNQKLAELNSEEMRKMTPAMYAAKGAAADLDAAFETLNATSGDVATKGQAIIEVMQRLSGVFPSQDEALQKWNDHMRLAKDSFAKVKQESKEFPANMIDAAGAIDTASQAGSQLQDVLQQAATDMAAYGQSLKDSGESAGEIVPKLAGMRTEFGKHLKELGLTDTQIQKIMDHYGLMPDKIVTQLGLEGDTQTQQTITDIASDLMALPKNTGLKVDVLSGPAQKALIDLGYHIVSLPDGTFQVFSNTEPGKAAADKFAQDYNGRVLTMPIDVDTTRAVATSSLFVDRIGNTVGTMTLDANKLPAGGKLEAQIKDANGAVGTMTFDARREPASGKLSIMVQDVNGAYGWMTIDAYNQAAKSKIGDSVRVANGSTGFINVGANTATAESQINWTARNRVATITTKVVGSTIARSDNSGRVVSGLNYNAKGGLVGYASGGMMHSVPRFASGGAYGALDITRGGLLDGPGTGTSDSIMALTSKGPAAVSTGEYVIRASQTRKHLALLRAINNGVDGFASGGMVKWGDVSQAKWDSLYASGWRGNPKDGMEALYSPAGSIQAEDGSWVSPSFYSGKPTSPASTYQARAASHGGGAMTVKLEVATGGSTLEQLFAEFIRNYVRVQGGNVQAVFGR